MGHPYKQMWKSLNYYWVNVLYFMRFIIQIIVTTTCYIFSLVGSKKRFSIFDVPPYQSVHFMAYLTALSLCLHLCLTPREGDIPSVKKKISMAVFMLVKVVTHNTGR